MQLPGQRRLQEHVAASSQSEVATRLNVKQQAISRWIRGSTIPNAFYQQALEKAFGIKREEWLSAAQVLALRALERDAQRAEVSSSSSAPARRTASTSSKTPPASTRTPTKRARTSSPASSSAAPSKSPPKRRASSPSTSSSTTGEGPPATDLPGRVLALLAKKGEKMMLGDLADELDCERIELYRVLHALKEAGQVVEIPATGNTRVHWELAGSAGARARLVTPRTPRASRPSAPAPSSPPKATPEERTLPLFGEPHNPIRVRTEEAAR